MIPFRRNVARMTAYVPGEQPPADAPVIKLNTNENPYPPSPKVAEAIRAELDAGTAPGERLRLYSDPRALAFRQAAGRAYGFPVEQILAGNGSDELLALLARAFVGEGKSIAYPYPTYMLYETLTHAQAGRLQVCYFPRDFALPRQLFGSKARLVLLATPNSPSGTLFPAPLLQELARSLKRGVLVIDEAYSEFASENALALAREEPNVAVLRTLSKSHSLAGMRLGLLFGPKELVAGLWKVKDSYNLDRLAIVAGAAALGDAAWTAANTARIRATRERTARELAALDLEVLPSQSNFLFARLGDSAAARGAYQFLKARNVLVRYFPLRLLDDGVRISIGSDEQMDELLRLLKKYLADGSRRR